MEYVQQWCRPWKKSTIIYMQNVLYIFQPLFLFVFITQPLKFMNPSLHSWKINILWLQKASFPSLCRLKKNSPNHVKTTWCTKPLKCTYTSYNSQAYCCNTNIPHSPWFGSIFALCHGSKTTHTFDFCLLTLSVFMLSAQKFMTLLIT